MAVLILGVSIVVFMYGLIYHTIHKTQLELDAMDAKHETERIKRQVILADAQIREQIKNGSLEIDPLTEISLQPGSYDLHIGDTWAFPRERGRAVNLQQADGTYTAIKGDSIVLKPGQFVLAATQERVKLPDYLAATVCGRSSVGRQGLIVETAGFIDPGFNGTITLELYNLSPNDIYIEAGTRICQLAFQSLTASASHGYAGKYNGQSAAQVSLMGEDAEVTDTITLSEFIAEAKARRILRHPELLDGIPADDIARQCSGRDNCLKLRDGTRLPCHFYNKEENLCKLDGVIKHDDMLTSPSEWTQDERECIDKARGLKYERSCS